MIVRPRRGFLPLLLTLQGSILPAVMPKVILVASLAAAAFAVHETFPNYFPNYGLAPFSILGLMLSLLLGFRNNASYARWWEARQQLGSLLVECRTLARLSMSYLTAAPHSQQRCMLLIRAFSRTLLYGLRQRPLPGSLDELLDQETCQAIYTANNPANQVLRLLSLEVAYAHQQGHLSDIFVNTFETRITAMTEIQAACERLHNTPIPFAYMLLVHRTAYLFCFLLPFGLVASVGISAPFISALVAYVFFGLDALSEELEEPFGERPNQLPLFAIERTIEINVLEAQGLPIPEPIEPQGYWLN
ncbi:MAG: bestrophin family ion channel [Pseudomonas sp.]|nr:bestrophin family ion channel [Pseudomonas sp.]